MLPGLKLLKELMHPSDGNWLLPKPGTKLNGLANLVKVVLAPLAFADMVLEACAVTLPKRRFEVVRRKLYQRLARHGIDTRSG